MSTIEPPGGPAGPGSTPIPAPTGTEAASGASVAAPAAYEADDRPRWAPPADAPAPVAAATVARSSVLLVGIGIAAGVFVLYAIGWAFGTTVTPLRSTDSLTQVMLGIEVGLGIAAGPLWFLAALLLTRRRRTGWRLLVQALGIVLLVPWPFLGVWL